MGVADKAADSSDACAVVSSAPIATHDVLHALELPAILLASFLHRITFDRPSFALPTLPKTQ